MTASGKGFRILPPDEDRCVWMSAGILSYQLCDRALDCENCPLDAAMRKHDHARATRRESEAGQPASPSPPSGLRGECQYSPNHCWLKNRGPGTVRVGMEPGLTSALLDPRAIVLPSCGQAVMKGRTCLWVVMDGGTFALQSPVSGTVASTNDNLAASPRLLNSDPFDRGWLLDIEWTARDSESEGLLDPATAAGRFAADQSSFLVSLAETLRGKAPSVGPTLADGGQNLLSLSAMLGPERYFKLLRKAFGR